MPLSTAICTLRTTWHDGVRFDDALLGYPREWTAPARSLCGSSYRPTVPTVPGDRRPATGRFVPGSQGLIRCDTAVCNRRVDDTPRGPSICEPAAYRGGVGVSPPFADAATASCACLRPLIAPLSPLRSPSARKRLAAAL